jgi:hypothetical protein
MKLHNVIACTMFAGLLITGVSACEKGPAEKAGEAIDEAASDVADEARETTEAIENKTGQE